MRKLFLAVLPFLALSILAQTPPAPDPFVNQALTQCDDNRVVRKPLEQTLPTGLTGELIEVSSHDAACGGTYAFVKTKAGERWIGRPWFLPASDDTIEKRIQQFAWQNMQETFTATIDRSARTSGGLHPVTLQYTTEHGKVPLTGLVDPRGSVLLFGRFLKPGETVQQMRVEQLKAVLAKAPVRNPAAKISVLEFSDFQCPSCMMSSKTITPLLAKFGSSVAYTRVDLPLIGNHPWAFAAATMGRAIHRQNPAVFWQYKDFIYVNQGDLNNFTLAARVRGFAADHDLDLKRFDADLASESLRAEILEGIGAAFSLQIQSTPTFIVDGVKVSAGEDGKALADYIQKRLDESSK